MFLRHLIFLLVAACLRVYAQTVTTTNDAGISVIEVITTDANGLPLTQVLQTVTTAAVVTSATGTTAATTATAATTTTPEAGPGPVGAPAPTVGTPGGPTPYTYTTVIGGVTTAVQDVFTPTSPQTVQVIAPSSGTILDYSSWLAVYGPQSTTKSSAAGISFIPPSVVVLVTVTVLGWTAAFL